MTYLNKIDKEALLNLCLDYDIKYKDYPESLYEGQAIYEFLLYQLGEAKSQYEDLSSWLKRSDEYARLIQRRRKVEVTEVEE